MSTSVSQLALIDVECRRVAADDNSLSRKYVTQGVHRFVTGQYAQGHHWGMLLGYVLKLPVSPLIDEINSRTASSYGQSATLEVVPAHQRMAINAFRNTFKV